MCKYRLLGVLIWGFTLVAGGCASSDVEPLQEDMDLLVTDEAQVPCKDCKPAEPTVAETANHFIQLNEKMDRLSQVKISATGYGAPPKSFFPEGQRRLMALRAAKMDAMRALAERINGLRIWGGTTVGNMVVEKDRYRTILDAYVRGATVVSVSPMDYGNYEAVVEILVDQKFLSYVLPGDGKPEATGSEPGSMPGSSGIPSTFYYSE